MLCRALDSSDKEKAGSAPKVSRDADRERKKELNAEYVHAMRDEPMAERAKADRGLIASAASSGAESADDEEFNDDDGDDAPEPKEMAEEEEEREGMSPSFAANLYLT